MVRSVARASRIAHGMTSRSVRMRIRSAAPIVGAGHHREPQIGSGQRGRVVDPVADHGDRATLFPQADEHPGLVGGHHFGDDLADADLRGHGPRGGFVVPGQQHCAQPQLVQFGDRRGGAGPDGVGDGDHALPRRRRRPARWCGPRAPTPRVPSPAAVARSSIRPPAAAPSRSARPGPPPGHGHRARTALGSPRRRRDDRSRRWRGRPRVRRRSRRHRRNAAVRRVARSRRCGCRTPTSVRSSRCGLVEHLTDQHVDADRLGQGHRRGHTVELVEFALDPRRAGRIPPIASSSGAACVVTDDSGIKLPLPEKSPRPSPNLAAAASIPRCHNGKRPPLESDEDRPWPVSSRCPGGASPPPGPCHFRSPSSSWSPRWLTSWPHAASRTGDAVTRRGSSWGSR